MSQPHTLRIAARFCGPPGTGNGGYVCGSIAGELPSAQVRLQRPAPLEQELRVEDAEDGALRALAGEEVIAVGRAQPLALEVPPAPSLAAAQRASGLYVGTRLGHPFSACFVCGPARLENDGLRIFAGAIKDGVVAAPFSRRPI